MSGIGISVLIPALYDAAAQDPKHPGITLGAMTAGSRVGALIAPIGVGLLADLSVFTVGAAMIIFALPCLMIMRLFAKRIQLRQ